MQLLLIVPNYYPNEGPRAWRWTGIAQQMAREGHEVHVLTGIAPGADRGRIITDGVIVHRTGYTNLLACLRGLPPAAKSTDSGVLDPWRPAGIGEFGQAALRRLWRKLYWPDGACVWRRPARRLLRELLSAYKFDALISSSLPFTAHLLGLEAMRMRPDIPWLVDIGDPFSFGGLQPNHYRYRYRNWQTENRILRLADAVTVTCENTARLYEDYFPVTREKLLVLPPLYRAPAMTAGRAPFMPPHRLNIGFFGSFYHWIREPEVLLGALQALLKACPEFQDRLQFHLFGNLRKAFFPSFRRFPELQSNTTLHGWVSRASAAAAMQQCDALLSLGNANDVHLPSKCVDYWMSGRPLLHIQQTVHDPFWNFFADYPLPKCALPAGESLTEEAIRGFRQWAYLAPRCRMERKQLVKKIQAHDQTRLARRYLEKIEEVKGMVNVEA